MDNGRAAEFGSPKELLERTNGAFTSMVEETGKSTAKMLRSVASGATTMADSRQEAARAARAHAAVAAPAFNGLQVSDQIMREAREAEALLQSLAQVMEDHVRLLTYHSCTCCHALHVPNLTSPLCLCALHTGCFRQHSLGFGFAPGPLSRCLPCVAELLAGCSQSPCCSVSTVNSFSVTSQRHALAAAVTVRFCQKVRLRLQEQTQRMVNQYADRSAHDRARDPRSHSMADIAGNLASVSQLMSNIKGRLASIRSDMHAPLEALTMSGAGGSTGAGPGTAAPGTRDGSENSHASLSGMPPERASLGARPMGRQQSAAVRDGAAAADGGGQGAPSLARAGRQQSVAMGRQLSTALQRQQSAALRDGGAGGQVSSSSFFSDGGRARQRRGPDSPLANMRLRFTRLRDRGRNGTNDGGDGGDHEFAG